MPPTSGELVLLMCGVQHDPLLLPSDKDVGDSESNAEFICFTAEL